MIFSKKTVLIVDDDEAIRKLCSIVFEKANVNIIEASTGTEALNKVREGNPNLIILDVSLPDISGMEICRIIKQDNTIKNIPVILFTAHGKAKTVEMGFDSGADSYIIKPVNWDLFRKKVGKFLNINLN